MKYDAKVNFFRANIYHMQNLNINVGSSMRKCQDLLIIYSCLWWPRLEQEKHGEKSKPWIWSITIASDCKMTEVEDKEQDAEIHLTCFVLGFLGFFVCVGVVV